METPSQSPNQFRRWRWCTGQTWPSTNNILTCRRTPKSKQNYEAMDVHIYQYMATDTHCIQNMIIIIINHDNIQCTPTSCFEYIQYFWQPFVFASWWLDCWIRYIRLIILHERPLLKELLSLGTVEIVGAPSTSWKTKSGMVNWLLGWWTWRIQRPCGADTEDVDM